MSKGLCDTCKKYGKCEWTRNGPCVNYVEYCYCYKPTNKPPICDAEKKHDDTIKLERLRDKLKEMEESVCEELKNAEQDENTALLTVLSTIRTVQEWAK